MREYKKGNKILSVYKIEGSGYCYWELRGLDRAILTTGICPIKEIEKVWG